VVRQPSNSGRDPASKDSNLAWSALFVVAAVVGGLAAADITHESALIAVAFSLLVAAVLVIALYRGLLDRAEPVGDRDDRPVWSRPGPPVINGGAEPGGYEAGGPRDRRRQEHQGALDPVVQPGVVRLVQPDSAGGAWWEAHAPASPATRAAQSPGPGKVDLSQFLDQAVIAQCPNCGSFRIDVDNRAAKWLFGCRECRKRWAWEPGNPWPPIQVRPDARK
jgi:hypothetical protein